MNRLLSCLLLSATLVATLAGLPASAAAQPVAARQDRIKAMGQLLIPGNREIHNRANMVQTLRRLKLAAETQPAA